MRRRARRGGRANQAPAGHGEGRKEEHQKRTPLPLFFGQRRPDSHLPKRTSVRERQIYIERAICSSSRARENRSLQIYFSNPPAFCPANPARSPHGQQRERELPPHCFWSSWVLKLGYKIQAAKAAFDSGSVKGTAKGAGDVAGDVAPRLFFVPSLLVHPTTTSTDKPKLSNNPPSSSSSHSLTSSAVPPPPPPPHQTPPSTPSPRTPPRRSRCRASRAPGCKPQSRPRPRGPRRSPPAPRAR